MAKKKPTYAESLEKISSADVAIKEALARKRELIEKSKCIAYDTLSSLYELEGQELIDAVTAEHELITKLSASGMTYEQLAELVDGSRADDADEQLSFDDEKHNPYAD